MHIKVHVYSQPGACSSRLTGHDIGVWGLDSHAKMQKDPEYSVQSKGLWLCFTLRTLRVDGLVVTSVLQVQVVIPDDSDCTVQRDRVHFVS